MNPESIKSKSISTLETMPYYAKYEPIVSRSLEIYSTEILFRLNNFNNAHVRFLSEIRAKNQTFFVFTMICRRAFQDQMFTWNKININLEIQDLLNPLFFNFLDELHSEILIDPTKINFEILENYEINDENKFIIVKKIKLLSKKWFNISIDDLFSWYSNKQRIDFLLAQDVNLSMVKIDWNFIQKAYLCNKYWYDCSLLKKEFSLNDISDFKNYIKELKSKWIDVVAEWIETEDMLDFVKSIWIDYFQWYLFQDFQNDKIYRL